MLIWQNPILDRTKADTERVKALREKGYENFSAEELEEWLSGMKGALNVSDLERIKNNILVLADVLEVSIEEIIIPKNPNAVFLSSLLDAVNQIRDAYFTFSKTPDTPTMPLTLYGQWNDIEQILNDIYELLNNNFYYYCGGEIYSGDSIGWLL